MPCNHLREFYEPYALGTLEGPERLEIGAHLARACAECTLGVEQARDLVASLAYLAPQTAPPAALKSKLMSKIIAAPMAVPQAAPSPVAPPARQTVVEMKKPVQAAAPFRWAWAAAAAVVLFAVLTGQYLQLQRQTGALREELAELHRQQNELLAETRTYRQAMAIAESGATRAITLTSTGQTPFIRAFWNESLGMVVSASQMPPPASDRTFQLWVVPKTGAPISAGIFRPDAAGRVLLVSSPNARITDAAALAITDEPAAGSPAPTTTPIWVGPLGS